MSQWQAPSVLKPLEKWISFFGRIGSLPIRISDDGECLHFKRYERAHLRFFGLVVLTQVINNSRLLAFAALDYDVRRFMVDLNASGLGMTEIVAVVGIFTAVTVISYLVHFDNVHAAEPLTDFSHHMSRLPSVTALCPDEVKSCSLRARKHFWIVTAGLAIIGTVNGISFVDIFRDVISMSDSLFLALCIPSCMIQILNLMSPFILATFLLSCHALEAMTSVARKYADLTGRLVTTKGVTQKPEKPIHTQVAQVKASGLVIFKAFEAGNKAFGPMIFYNLAVDVICQVFGLFFGVGVFESFFAGQFNRYLFVASLSYLLMGGLSLYKAVGLIRKGQYLKDAIKSSGLALEEFVRLNLSYLTEEDRHCLESIMEECSKTSVIRPKDSFDLTFATGIALTGNLITYIIVLLQFKSIE